MRCVTPCSKPSAGAASERPFGVVSHRTPTHHRLSQRPSTDCPRPSSVAECDTTPNCMRKGGCRGVGNGKAPAQPGLVRQLRQSGHDVAVPGAVSQFRADPGRAPIRAADHRHRPDRQRFVTLQPPSHGSGGPGQGGHPRRRRRRFGVPHPSDPRDRQAADRRARPQPRLSVAGGGAVRLSAGRGGADHRLRQDHAGLPDGCGHGRHPGHRAVRRADAGRALRRPAGGLGHHRLGGAQAPRHRRDRL